MVGSVELLMRCAYKIKMKHKRFSRDRPKLDYSPLERLNELNDTLIIENNAFQIINSTMEYTIFSRR